MKTKTAKKIVTFILSAILAIVPVFSAFAAEAENAKIVDSAAGRSVVVQDLVSEGGKAELPNPHTNANPKGERLINKRVWTTYIISKNKGGSNDPPLFL